MHFDSRSANKTDLIIYPIELKKMIEPGSRLFNENAANPSFQLFSYPCKGLDIIVFPVQPYPLKLKNWPPICMPIVLILSRVPKTNKIKRVFRTSVARPEGRLCDGSRDHRIIVKSRHPWDIRTLI